MAESDELRLHRLEIQDFMRIDAMAVDLDGNSVLITGPNASGKTTTVDAVWWALGGRSARDVKDPVRDGKKQASVTLDLGKYTVTKTSRGERATLVVRASDGAAVQKPQQLLQGFLAEYTLDPVAFLEKRPQDQVDDLLRVCHITPPVEEVAKITGTQHPAMEGESAAAYLARLAADETGLYYQHRRQQSQIADRKKKAAEEARRKMRELGGELGEDETSPSLAVISVQIEKLHNECEQRQEVYRQLAHLNAEIIEAEKRAVELAEEIGFGKALIADLRRQIAVQTERVGEYTRGQKDVKGDIVVLKDKLKAKRSTFEQMRDPTPLIAQAQDHMKECESKAIEIQRRKQAVNDMERLSTEATDAEADVNRTSDCLERLRGLRGQLLIDTGTGVPGLSVGANGLLLNGHPLSQASGSEDIDLACAIAMRERPKLKLLRIDNGEHLDAEHRKRLFEIAHENGFQVLLTCVADQSDLRVEIVDINEGKTDG